MGTLSLSLWATSCSIMGCLFFKDLMHLETQRGRQLLYSEQERTMAAVQNERTNATPVTMLSHAWLQGVCMPVEIDQGNRYAERCS